MLRATGFARTRAPGRTHCAIDRERCDERIEALLAFVADRRRGEKAHVISD